MRFTLRAPLRLALPAAALLSGCLLDWDRLRTPSGDARAEAGDASGDTRSDVVSEPPSPDARADSARDAVVDSPLDAFDAAPSDALDEADAQGSDAALDGSGDEPEPTVEAGAEGSVDAGDASDASDAVTVSDAADVVDAADAMDVVDVVDVVDAGCGLPSECPGVDTECVARTCTLGVCGFSFTASGHRVTAQTAGDCRVTQCNGTGATMSAVDNTDLPVDGNQCTQDLCTAGTPGNPPVASHTMCTMNGGNYCDGVGRCLVCITAADCPGSDSECSTRVCTAGSCSVRQTTSGTRVTTQTAGDCHVNQCDGSGGVTTAIDNTDVPVDGNQCSLDQCAAGVPANPPAPARTSCSMSSGTLCNGSGTCVQCVSPTDCPLNNVCTTAGTCAAIPPLVLSQVQTRGTAGGNDEFVEIYNPTSTAVVFDSMWSVVGRSAVGTCTSNLPGTRFMGAGQTIPPHGHLLYANTNSSGYDGSVGLDMNYTTGFVDAGSVVLMRGTVVIDTLCYYFDTASLNNLTTCATPYACEGSPVMNPHNNSTTGSSALDSSLERRPGGAAGNATDSNDNSADFVITNPSTPRNLASSPTP